MRYAIAPLENNIQSSLEQTTLFDISLKGEPPLLRLKQPATLSCVIKNKSSTGVNVQVQILQDETADSGVFIQEVTSRVITSKQNACIRLSCFTMVLVFVFVCEFADAYSVLLDSECRHSRW